MCLLLLNDARPCSAFLNVSSWTKSRGTAGKRELSRSEFKDEVERMGLTAKGKPATRKQIGALFDTVDEDRSGWLDMEEAKQALKRCAPYTIHA